MSDHANEAPTSRFEGSYLGERARLPQNARLECKICWWVYDPAVGDPVWQIEPGLSFAELPEYWRCPECDGDADQFMVLTENA
ncbi:rubredoxin [Diaphorobacter sp. HDW4A]|uniref:rubredoxin n=1 Tax=Diaphorobacter sp. HDW4A TaxID=2714924 RepID=UPI00140A3A55|nr:rubredoxin [Diaphorobacter sp. HDW4A]QIL79448.1 rubredoxin [Diaphorobacter sp. HDW4A]